MGYDDNIFPHNSVLRKLFMCRVRGTSVANFPHNSVLRKRSPSSPCPCSPLSLSTQFCPTETRGMRYLNTLPKRSFHTILSYGNKTFWFLSQTQPRNHLSTQFCPTETWSELPECSRPESLSTQFCPTETLSRGRAALAAFGFPHNSVLRKRG